MHLSSILARTREVCRRKHLSWATEEAYTGWIHRYATFLSGLKEKGRDQGLSSEAKFERFLTRIAKSGCAASTQNQAFNAVIFLYKNVLEKPLERVQALRARRPAHVRPHETCSGTKRIAPAIISYLPSTMRTSPRIMNHAAAIIYCRVAMIHSSPATIHCTRRIMNNACGTMNYTWRIIHYTLR